MFSAIVHFADKTVMLHCFVCLFMILAGQVTLGCRLSPASLCRVCLGHYSTSSRVQCRLRLFWKLFVKILHFSSNWLCTSWPDINSGQVLKWIKVSWLSFMWRGLVSDVQKLQKIIFLAFPPSGWVRHLICDKIVHLSTQCKEEYIKE